MAKKSRGCSNFLFARSVHCATIRLLAAPLQQIFICFFLRLSGALSAFWYGYSILHVSQKNTDVLQPSAR